MRPHARSGSFLTRTARARSYSVPLHAIAPPSIRIGGAVDERGVVGGEEADELRDLLRPAEALDQVRPREERLDHLRILGRLPELLHHGGVDRRRAVAVGANVVVAEVDRHALRQADDRVLRGGVGRAHGEPGDRRGRAGVDDRAAARRLDVRVRELRPEPDALQVDVHQRVPHLDREVLDGHVGREKSLSCTPALLCRTCSAPNASTAPSTSAWISSCLRMSAWM